MHAAEAELAAAVEQGREALRRAQEVSARIRPTRLSDEDIRLIDRAARGGDAPPELRALADRVQRGELSWREIVDGYAMHDAGVQAAMRANLAQLGRVYRKFEEGYPLDEVLASEAAARTREEPEGGTVLKHSSW